MELFHNQVTREQGLFSLRFHHQSFGLYFIAENIRVPTVVLDFPSEARFIREIRKGYDYVGISFIAPNFVKAKRMAELVREHAPESQIVLGGHGTPIPGIEDLVEHDHICRGEGVKWFRRLLGEDPDRPLRHPALPSGFSKRVLGTPLKTEAAVLIPGVGCPNACRFCATSHLFDKQYTPYFDSGRELFDACEQIEKKLGMTEFFVMDENFLKRPERARELMDLMEEHGKFWRFGIFSSAETIAKVGVKFLSRLGVFFLWLGVESKREVYEKNRGVDLKAMIRELRDHGISVLASGILFLEHHDKESIWDDIRYVVDLEADLVQFMQLGPIPQTRLFREYAQQGKLREDVPYEEQHGQCRIWFDHPHFSPEESERYLRDAFRFDFDTQGSSLLRMCDTVIRGYRHLARYVDPILRKRRKTLKALAEGYRPILDALRRYAHNDHVRARTEEIIARYRETLGPASIRQKIRARLVRYFASREAARVAAGRTVYQPKTLETRYRMSMKDLVAGVLRGKTLSSLLNLDIQWGRNAVLVKLGGTFDKVNARALVRKLRSYMKGEGGEVILSLDRLAFIDDKALKKLIKGIKRYRGRVRLVYEEGAEAVRAAISNLPGELAAFFSEPEPEPA
jgi:anti-anti-sigma regulatory factor